jgi:hypothetical protein
MLLEAAQPDAGPATDNVVLNWFEGEAEGRAAANPRNTATFAAPTTPR